MDAWAKKLGSIHLRIVNGNHLANLFTNDCKEPFFPKYLEEVDYLYLDWVAEVVCFFRCLGIEIRSPAGEVD